MDDTISRVTTLPPVPPTTPTGPPPPPPWLSGGPPRPRRWPGLATLGIALATIGLAIGAWFRPLPGNKPIPAPAKPTFTDQQVADAKANVCAAFAKVDHALDIAGGRSGGSDQTTILAVATGTRQVLDAGSRYLLTKLAEEPSTPPDLAGQIRKLANSWQEMAVDYLAEVSDAELSPSLRASDEATSSIRGLCK